MLQKIKAFLKHFLPPPIRAFNREIERILSAIQKQGSEQNAALNLLQERQNALETQLQATFAQQDLLIHTLQTAQQQVQTDLHSVQAQQCAHFSQLSAWNDTLLLQIAKLSEENETLRQTAAALGEELTQTRRHLQQQDLELAAVSQAAEHISTVLSGEIAHSASALSEKIERTRLQVIDGSQNASEAVWAEIFNNAISGSPWLTNTAFSPGRWAVGYPVLYVMYRILNEARPKRILELGLGQSTRMIAQYAAAYDGVEHIVVEHDPEWISFFENDFQLSSRSKIVQLDREMVPYKEAEAVRVFRGFRDRFQGQKFDFISIDAPLGGDMKQYARIDVLGLLPDCLSDDFVIMLDDAERSGESTPAPKWSAA